MKHKFEKGNTYGKGGARPHSGPPKDEVKQKFRKMLEDSGAHKRFQEILQTETNREIFLKAYQICLDRGFGKPAIDVEVGGEGLIDIAALATLVQQTRNRDPNPSPY